MRGWKILFCLVSTVAFAAGPVPGNEGGHSGDPYKIDFLQRASFALEQMKTMAFTPSLVELYETALKELRVVPTDDVLPTTGRVLPDPERPGFEYVRLERKKYSVALGKRFTIDLTAFVAHEVFETKGRDYENEITRDLHFDERTFDQWHRQHPAPVGQVGVISQYGQVIPQQGGTAILNQYGGAAVPPGYTGVVGPNGSAIAPPGYTIQIGPNGASIVPISTTPQTTATNGRPPMPPRTSPEWCYVGREATYDSCAQRCSYAGYWWWQVGGTAPNNGRYENDGCFCAVRKAQ